MDGFACAQRPHGVAGDGLLGAFGKLGSLVAQSASHDIGTHQGSLGDVGGGNAVSHQVGGRLSVSVHRLNHVFGVSNLFAGFAGGVLAESGPVGGVGQLGAVGVSG